MDSLGAFLLVMDLEISVKEKVTYFEVYVFVNASTNVLSARILI